MSIRHATAEDRTAVIRMLRAAHGETGLDGEAAFKVKFDPAYANSLFEAHRQRPEALCLIYAPDGQPRGVLMALASWHPFGPVRCARETLWWIEPEFRGRGALHMLSAYEAWAREVGCAYVGMAGLGHDPRVGRMYERRGYTRAETHFLKEV